MARKSVSADSCIDCKQKIENKIDGQTKCVDCIMKSAPKLPMSDSSNKEESVFVNWFIYNWRKFKATAKKMKS